MVDDGLIAFANRLADAGGAVIRPYFRKRIDVAHKEGKHAFDPSPKRIAARARHPRPDRQRAADDAILGEEFGETPGKNDYRWCSIRWTARAPLSPAAMNGAS